MYEHILVLEQQMLGWYQTTGEHVYHINGDKLDNRLENLKLMTIADHNRLHHLKGPLEDRVCCLCGSTTTQVRPPKRPNWLPSLKWDSVGNALWKCQKCYLREYNNNRSKKPKTIVRLLHTALCDIVVTTA